MTTTINKPSERSVNYLTDLVKTRQAGKFGTSAEQDLLTLSRWFAKEPRSQKDVSGMIDRVKNAPRRGPGPLSSAAGHPAASPLTKPRPVAYPPVPDSVNDSRYAVYTEVLTSIPEGWRSQEHLFFEVKKLKGRRVIRRLVGAPGRYTRAFVPADLATELFGHLANEAFAKSCSDLYGFLYTCCGTCGAELTDDDSIARSQGPICMKRWAK